ncbi:hypothetical protein EXIGLDRAFT_724870 [Exidia glandulosa HHB12029]|uniref:F-box domain-containing protein n=1 Tax=Exidia glandulosa HHB12029 TaxID=1314781 RepID=A0A165E8M0_EXIGL|nr:hypothetical protein EXIGLDRAFT_724870 [Exidia glandulosa HHB12029]
MAELPARRMTRQRRRNVLAQFSRLPLEIVRQIVTMAAEGNIGYASRWVAQSLAVVCQEFRDAVEPVLMATVRLSRKHHATISAQRDRLPRTMHFINHIDDSFAPPPCVSLASFSGRMTALYTWVVNYGLPVAPWVTIHDNFPGYHQRRLERPYAFFHGVTRLHIQYYALSSISLTALPVSITHIVLTLSFFILNELEDFKAEVTALLASNRNVRRVLLRTLHFRPREAVDLVADYETLATQLHESRIWVDDSVAYGSDASGAMAHLYYEEANEQDSVWFLGRQLYHATPPA